MEGEGLTYILHSVISFTLLFVYLFGTCGRYQHGANLHFSRVSRNFVQGTKILFHRGGIYTPFHIVRKRRFKNVWVKGGWVTIFFSTEAKLFGVSGFSGIRSGVVGK